MPAPLVDRNTDFSRGYFDTDNQQNVPPNSIAPPSKNVRLMPNGSLRSRRAHLPFGNKPVGYYTVVASLTYTGGVCTCSSALFSSTGGVETSSDGGDKWMVSLNGTLYPITGSVTDTSFAVSGLAGSGTVTTGNWFVCYVGRVMGMHRWYQESDPTQHAVLLYYGSRLDSLDDNAAPTILKSNFAGYLQSVPPRMHFEQSGNLVICSNGVDSPIFVDPSTSTVTGQTANYAAPAAPIPLFSLGPATTYPDGQTILTGSPHQEWGLSRMPPGGGANYGFMSPQTSMTIRTATSAGVQTGAGDRYLDYLQTVGSAFYQHDLPAFLIADATAGVITGAALSVTNGNTTITLSSGTWSAASGDVLVLEGKFYNLQSATSNTAVVDRGIYSTTGSYTVWFILKNKFVGAAGAKLSFTGTPMAWGQGLATLDSQSWGSASPVVYEGDILVAWINAPVQLNNGVAGTCTYTGYSEAFGGHTYYLHKVVNNTGSPFFLSKFGLEAAYRGVNMSLWMVSLNGSGGTYYNTAYCDNVGGPGVTESAIYFWTNSATPPTSPTSGNLYAKPQPQSNTDASGYGGALNTEAAAQKFGAGNVPYRVALCKSATNDPNNRTLQLDGFNGIVYNASSYALIRGNGIGGKYSHCLFHDAKGSAPWDYSTFWQTAQVLGIPAPVGGVGLPTLGCAIVDIASSTFTDGSQFQNAVGLLEVPVHTVSTTFQQRIIFGDLKDWDGPGTRHPKRIDYTRLNNIQELEGDSKEIGDSGAGGQLRLMFGFQNALWAVRDRGMYSLTGPTLNSLRILETFPGVGAAAQATLGRSEAYVMWLDTLPAIWMFSGGPPRDVSNPIKNVLYGLSTTDYANSRAFMWRGRYYITFGNQQYTYIYDPSFDPQDEQGGGWVRDDWGVTAGVIRRGGAETTDFLFCAQNYVDANGAQIAWGTAQPQYVLRGEVDSAYDDQYGYGATTVPRILNITTNRRMTQEYSKTKKWRKFVALVTSQATGSLVPSASYNMGDGAWNTFPITF